MDAGRPEQILAAHHLGDALQRVVNHDREVIAGRRLPAREDDVAPGLRPGGDRAGLASGPSPRSIQARSPAIAAPPPYRAAAQKARPTEAALCADRQQAISQHPDKAAPRRGRAAIARSPRAARPVSQSRRGFRNSDKRDPEPRGCRPHRGSRPDAGIAGAPAPPRRYQANRGLDRSRFRIPVCSASGRYPRSAAEICRRPVARNRNSATPNRRGRDEDSRLGSAQSGRQAAALISFIGHDDSKSQ